jgi:hypothetical protein
MPIFTSHRNLKTLDRYNQTKELKACVARNVFHIPCSDNIGVVVQYDEHLKMTMGQWDNGVLKRLFLEGF